MKKIIGFCLLLCSLLLITSCGEKYKYGSSDVNNYYIQPISLKSGESYTFDVLDIFKDSGLEIDKYTIETSANKNYTVRGDTITAVGTGVSSISVSLYCSTDKTRYMCSLGTLYSYDEKDFTPISTASELQGITDLNGKYILAADIDLAGIENWEPIGNLPDKEDFTGMFINPNNYKIKNLTISSATKIHQGVYGGCLGGLFGRTVGAFLCGIQLEDVYIDLSDFEGDSYSKAGGLVGMTSGTFIKDCNVTGIVKAVGRTGGIVGSVNWGCIQNCSFSGTVSANEDFLYDSLSDGATGAGGIAGYIGLPWVLGTYQYGLIGCSAKGKITAVKNAGGVAGYIWGIQFAKDCTFEGEVVAASADKLFGKVEELYLSKR